MENFNFKKYLAEGRLLKEMSWEEIDREMDRKRQELEDEKESFIITPKGKNAIQVINNLISKPYNTSDLRDTLEILNLSKKHFKFAAEKAGMRFNSNASGIHIFDQNYSDPDVSIDNIDGTWYVG
jgi:hypothetical protein